MLMRFAADFRSLFTPYIKLRQRTLMLSPADNKIQSSFRLSSAGIGTGSLQLKLHQPSVRAASG